MSFMTFFVKFSEADEKAASREHEAALEERAATRKAPRFKLPTVPPSTGRLAPMAMLRVYLGVALAIKGIFYIMDMGRLEAQLGGAYGQTETLIAWFVVLAHAVAGVALALGFATRWRPGLNAIVLAGAVSIHLRGATGFGFIGEDLNFQFALLVLVTLLVFFWQRAGRYSLDSLLNSDDRESHPSTG